MVYECVTKLTGRDFVFRSLNVVDLNYHCYLCAYFLLSVCEFILFEGISLHNPLLLYGVCVCLCVSEPAKHVPVWFSLLKGCLNFGFIYLKNLFLSFSLLTIIYCFTSLLSARTLIKHTLSALRTLNSLLFIYTQWSSRLLLRLVSAMFKNRMLFCCCGVYVWVECSDFSFCNVIIFFVQIDSSNVSGRGRGRGRGKYCTQLKVGGGK